MDDTYKNIDNTKHWYPNKKRKNIPSWTILLLICIIIKNLINKIVNSLLIRVRKANISLVFITPSFFKVSQNVKLNTKHFAFIKIRNKTELEQNGYIHASDTDCKDFMDLYRKCTAKPYSFLVIDDIFALDNSFWFRNTLLEKI